MVSYKEQLLNCQKYLSEGNYDKLLTELEKLKEIPLEGMTREEAEEALRILDFLISEVQKHQEEIFTKMVNYQKFKNYLR
ncbi:hypothetical protein [Aquifex sp.]